MENGSRPWGKYVVLAEYPYCKVKQIVVKPSHRLSYQYHKYREEVWTVVSGTATVVLQEEEIVLEAGETIKIPLGARHRIANYGTDDLIFIEVQTGSYFGEDDIIRLQDDYERRSETHL